MTLDDVQADGRVEGHAHLDYTPPELPDSRAHAILRIHSKFGVANFDAQLKHLSGDLTVKFEAAPSNRIWYGFAEKPDIMLNIVPPQLGGNNVTMVVAWIKMAVEWAVSMLALG